MIGNETLGNSSDSYANYSSSGAGAFDGSFTPTFENISSGKYPVSRSLFFYVKNAHVGNIPGISEYIAEFTSEKSFGTGGYLQEKGLIPSPDAERAEIRTNALGLSLAWLADFN